MSIEPVLTEISQSILAKRYLIRNAQKEVIETPKALFERVAKAIADAEPDPSVRDGWAKIFYTMMASCDFEPNTPCLVNAGRPDGTGQLSACFVIPVPDSMDGIFTAIKHMALVQKTGGGTGFAFSRLRPEGDFVASTSGIASGPISFMEVFDFATERIKQGGVRRGANMGILRIDHPDILKFIALKQDPQRMQNFNVSVAITDAFMLALEASKDYDLIHPVTGNVVGQLNSRAVWNEIVHCAHVIGDPGLWFIDRANAADPLSDALGPIEATNPSMPAGTRVHTNRGIVPIEQLEGTTFLVKAMDGTWADADCHKSSDHAELLEIDFGGGRTIQATPEHRWPVVDAHGNVRKVYTRDLKIGDYIPANRNERLGHIVDASLTYLDGLVAGMAFGDGSYNLRKDTDKPWLHFHFNREDVDLQEIAADYFGANISDQADESVVHVPVAAVEEFTAKVGLTFGDKRTLPAKVWQSNDEFVTGLVDGLFSTDGCIDLGNRRITFTNKSVALVREVAMLLAFHGVLGSFREGVTVLNGVEYPRADLSITLNSAKRFANVFRLSCGRKQAKLDELCSLGSRSNRRTYSCRVEAIRNVTPAAVWDIRVHHNQHVFPTEWGYTGNCGEVPLRPLDACCLGSINLSKFYIEKTNGTNTRIGSVTLRHGSIDFERLQKTVTHAVRFLDNMLSANRYPIDEIRDVTSKCRKIGLGVMGWADLLIQLGLSYQSPEARDLGNHVMQLINNWACDASEALAVERGPFHYWDVSKWKKLGRKPRRHSTVTVIAPTGTISMIAGCSSGIEPLFALSMTRDQAGLLLHEVNPLVEKIARREGFWSDELATVVKQTGSLATAPGVPDHWRAVFATANELGTFAHISMQSNFQAHTEDGVSKTINLHASATEADVESAYMLAWQLGCKGITVYRDGCRSGQVLTAGVAKSASPDTARAVVDEIPVLPTLARKRRVPDNGIRMGTTLSTSMPYGTVHMTLNHHPDDGDPFELFVRVGKSGSEIMAWAEAFGRVVSYTLSLPSPFSPKARLYEIARQLERIGGGDVWVAGQERVMSAPDAIAKLLLNYLDSVDATEVDTTAAIKSFTAPFMSPSKLSSEETTLVQSGRAKSKSLSDLCPACGNATFTYQQRCGICTNCGHSRC